MKLIKTMLLAGALIFNSNVTYSEVAQDTLTRYKNGDTFVCVGIYSSVSFEEALNTNFTKLYGIDEDPVLVQHAKIIMPDYISYNKRRNIFYDIRVGSVEEFRNVIGQIHTPYTVVLGNHVPDPDDAIKENTLLQQLEAIKGHAIKTHTILIDYIQYAGTRHFGDVTLEAIQQKVLEINPRYVFAFERGGHLGQEDKAVLVAFVRGRSRRRVGCAH